MSENSFEQNFEKAMAAAAPEVDARKDNWQAVYKGEIPLPSNDIALRKWRSREIFIRVLKVIGIKGSKIPSDFSGTFNVDGHKFVIYPQGYAPTSEGNIPKIHNRWRPGSFKVGGTVKTASHRVYIDFRGRLVPLGRLHQIVVK